MIIQIKESLVNQASDFVARYDQNNFSEEADRLRRDLHHHFFGTSKTNEFSDPVLHASPFTPVFNADWLRADADNWLEGGFLNHRVAETDIAIKRKHPLFNHEIATAHEFFLDKLTSQSRYSLGQKRTDAKKLLKRYEDFLLKQRQLFLENLREQLAKSVQEQLQGLGSYAKKERNAIFAELMFLASRTQERHLQDSYRALEMHERLYKLQKRIHTLADSALAAEVDVNAASQLKDRIDTFTIVSNRYVDNCLIRPIKPPQYKNIADSIVLAFTIIGMVGLILSLTTGYGALAYLGLLGTFMLAREIYYFSRDLSYKRSPSRGTIVNIVWGSLLIAGGVLTPIMTKTVGLVSDTIRLFSEMSYFATKAVKGISLLFHASIFAKFNVGATAMFTAVTTGVASAWAARRFNKASKSAALGEATPIKNNQDLISPKESPLDSESPVQNREEIKTQPAAKAKGKLLYFSKTGTFHENDSYAENIGNTQLRWYQLQMKKDDNISALRKKITEINSALSLYHSEYTSCPEMTKHDLHGFITQLQEISGSLKELISNQNSVIKANSQLNKQVLELKSQIKAEVAVISDLYNSEHFSSFHYTQDIGSGTKRRFDV